MPNEIKTGPRAVAKTPAVAMKPAPAKTVAARPKSAAKAATASVAPAAIAAATTPEPSKRAGAPAAAPKLAAAPKPAALPKPAVAPKPASAVESAPSLVTAAAITAAGPAQPVATTPAPTTPVGSVASAAPKVESRPAPAAPAVTPPRPNGPSAPLASAMETEVRQARDVYAQAQENGETLRQAMTASATATTRGVMEINGKVLDLMRAQSEVALDLWRSTLSAGSFSDALRVQASGVRQVYEATAGQWRELAETTGRVVSEATKPMRSALNR